MMKALFVVLFATAALCGQGVQQLLLSEGGSTTLSMNVGFDFRNSGAFVTDPANTAQVTNSAFSYPQTQTPTGSVTWGWEASNSGQGDRNAAIDPRIAGAHFEFNNSGSSPCFRVDLTSAGTYKIRLALGDDSFSGTHTVVIKDTSSVLRTIGPTATVAGSFLDATGTSYTDTNWPGSNSTITLTFTTTILRVCIGAATGGSDGSSIAHLFIL